MVAVMAQLTQSLPSASGEWVTFAEDDGPTLAALVHESTTEPEAGVTVYWPARNAPTSFVSFFDLARPQVRENPDDEWIERRLGYANQTGSLIEFAVPSTPNFAQLFFMRLEQQRLGSMGHEHPVLVAWCNLEAGRAATTPPDAGGVLLQPRHLPGLRQPLAQLIANTSATAPSLADVVSLLAALEIHLAGRPEPLAAAVA
jgi:hypothetical protein